jgi:hypothetical protein
MTEQAPEARRIRWEPWSWFVVFALVVVAFVAGAKFGWRDGKIVDMGCTWCSDPGPPDFLHLGRCILSTHREHLAFYGLALPEGASEVVPLPFYITNRNRELEDFRFTLRLPRDLDVVVPVDPTDSSRMVGHEGLPGRLVQGASGWFDIPGATRTVQRVGAFDYVIYSAPKIGRETRVFEIWEPIRLDSEALPEALAKARGPRSGPGLAACDFLRARITVSARGFGPYDYELRLKPLEAATVKELQDAVLPYLGEVCWSERRKLPFESRLRKPWRDAGPCASLLIPKPGGAAEDGEGTRFDADSTLSGVAAFQPEAKRVSISWPGISKLGGSRPVSTYVLDCERFR